MKQTKREILLLIIRSGLMMNIKKKRTVCWFPREANTLIKNTFTIRSESKFLEMLSMVTTVVCLLTDKLVLVKVIL